MRPTTAPGTKASQPWIPASPRTGSCAARTSSIRYDADLLYFDDTELPLGQYGIDLVTHYYNSSVRKHGKVDVVVTAKDIKPEHVGSVTLDIERGKANGILAQPWQTDTCIGNWYYERSLLDTHKYKTPTFVIHSLIDIVSRNGNLLLSIPLRGDGTIDEDEHAFLTGLASWMQVHGGAIYGTRPFSVFGEGPPDAAAAGTFNEKRQRPYTTEDIRFVTKGDTLYAFAFVWPTDGKLLIKTLARGSAALSAASSARGAGRRGPDRLRAGWQRPASHPPRQPAQPLRLRLHHPCLTRRSQPVEDAERGRFA